MLVACRLTGLYPALEAHYAGLVALTQTGHVAVCSERQRLERPHERREIGRPIVTMVSVWSPSVVTRRVSINIFRCALRSRRIGALRKAAHGRSRLRRP
jgi:hypothetical protein